MNRKVPIVLILLLVIASVGYLAFTDPQSPFARRPVQITETTQQKTTVVLTSTYSQIVTSSTLTTTIVLTTTKTTSFIPPRILVVSLTIQNRVLGGHGGDLMNVTLRLKNEGGPGMAVVQILQVLAVSKYKVLEKTYFVPANTELSFNETFIASPDAETFEAVIVQQIPT